MNSISKVLTALVLCSFGFNGLAGGDTNALGTPVRPGGISGPGKPEGPYVNTVPGGQPLRSTGIDATIFEDDDGKVYFANGGGGTIYLLKDDLSGFAESHAVKLEIRRHPHRPCIRKCRSCRDARSALGGGKIITLEFIP